MTLVQMFRCRACGWTWGPFGTHGFHPASKSGELIGKCSKCSILAVARVKNGAFESGCHQCGTAYEGHDGSCPKCSSRDCGFGPVM
jgi:hypothetical protein